MNHGKHYVDSAKLIDRTKTYEPQEALELCCKTAKAKFDETVELHVRLGVDSRHADQQVRGAVVLPNGTGKNVRVVAICKGDAAKAAEAAGAQEVGDDDLIAKIQGGYLDFDVLVTTPDMMGRVGRLGKILGPRGLMPNPKAGEQCRVGSRHNGAGEPEVITGAAPTYVHAKFYTQHLTDLSPEALVELAKLIKDQTGITFERDERGVKFAVGMAEA